MAVGRSLFVRLQNTVRGPIEKKLVFIHIPKCGGNSIASAIFERYQDFSPNSRLGLVNMDAAATLKAARSTFGTEPFEDDFHNVLLYREQLLFYFLNLRQTRLITGHFCFSSQAFEEFRDQFDFLTVLRDPVNRWISAFFYNKYREESEWNVEEDIADYLDTKRAHANGREYVKKFSGSVLADVDYSSDKVIGQAKENIDKLQLVGILEDLSPFKERFRLRFGVDLNIGERNRGPKSGEFKKSVISDELLARIRELCDPDIRIYDHAQKSAARAVTEDQNCRKL